MQRDGMINIPSDEKKNVWKKWKQWDDFPDGHVALEIFAVKPSGAAITTVPIKTFTFSRLSTIACFWTPELFPIKGGFWERSEKFEKDSVLRRN